MKNAYYLAQKAFFILDMFKFLSFPLHVFPLSVFNEYIQEATED